jgi:EAL domain-containing protein (putative c-di-GMP-specific phosphodiesterase class I)
MKEGESPLRLAVNVSAHQFQQTGFVQDVERALGESGFPPALLELELTESLFIGDFANACRIFSELRAIGITFALDDFGTGQSSLSYLQNLSFERLKIDQSFIRPIKDGDPLPPIVRNIINLSSSLGMATIAEGVETAHQSELLKAAHCQEGQGFLWSRPLPPDKFKEFFRGRTGS